MIRKLNFAFGALLSLVFSLALLFCARKERISFVRDDYSPSQGWVKSSYDWFGWYKEGVNYMILPGTERNYHAKFSVKVSKAHSDQLETFDASISDHKVLTFKTTAIYKFISSVVIKSENIPHHVKHYISSLDLLSSQIRDLTDEKGYYVGDLFAKLVVDKDANSSKLLLLDKTDGKQIADAFRFAGIFTSNLALLDYNVLLEYRLYGKTYFMPAKILEDATGLNTFEPMNEESKVLFVHGRFGSIQISYILPDLPVVEKEYSLPGDAVFNKSGGVSLRISQIESTPWADLLGFKGADCDVVKLYIHTQDGLIATDVQVSADGSFPLIIPADIAQTKNIQPGDKIVKAISCDDKRAINFVNITSNTTTAGIIIRPYQGSNGNGSLFQDAKIYDVKVDYTASPDLSGATFSPASKVYIEDFSDTQGRIQIEVPENTKVYLKYVLTASCVNKVVLSGSSVYSIGDNVLDCKDREYFEIKDQLKNITNASAIKVTAEDTRYTKTYDVSIKFIATITDVFEARFDQQGNLSVKTEINRGANEIIVKNINRRTWGTNPNGVNGNIYVSPDANVLYQISSSVNSAFDSYSLEPSGLVVKHQKAIPFADKLSIEKGDIDILHQSNILGDIPYKLRFEYLSQDTSLEELIISQVVGTETKTFKATPNALGNLIFTGLYKDKGVNVTSVRHKGVSSSLNAGYNFPDNPATATIKITAEDGTEKTYGISFAYQDNQAYIEKLVLVQRGGNIPGNGKVFSTEMLDGESSPRIVIDNTSHIITIKNIGKSGKPYLARGSFYIQEIKIEGDESTLSINVNGMLPNTTNLTVKQVNNVLSFASQDGLSTPSYKLQIEAFMGTEAKLSSILFKQTGLGTDYEGTNIPDKLWTLAPTTANLGTVNGVYKSRGIIDTISTTRSDFARASFVVFEPNQATHTLIRIIPEDEMNPVDYVFTPNYLSSCNDLTSVTFTQSQIKNQFNVLLPNRTIGTNVSTALLANTGTVTVKNDLANSLIKGNGTIRIANNTNFAVCSGAELKFMKTAPATAGSIDNLADNAPFDALEVIAEDRITSRKYTLIPNYLETEARLTSIEFKQQLAAPFQANSLTFSATPGVAFQQNVEILDFNNKIIIKGAYNRSGDISITNLTSSSNSNVYTPTDVPYVQNVNIITGNKPSPVAGAIVVESQDKVTKKTYQLVFEDLLGDEAKLLKISLQQNFNGLNDALDDTTISNRLWENVVPDVNDKLVVTNAIKNNGVISAKSDYTLSQIKAKATVSPAINNPSAEHDIITVQSQDLLTTKTYKVAPDYLSDCTGLTSIKLTQKGIPYYAGHNPSTQNDIDLSITTTGGNNLVANGKQFVQGKGRLVIENPILCNAGASLYLNINGNDMPVSLASIDNPNLLEYSDKLVVVSQDRANKATYSIKNLTYKNSGTKFASITFDYEHPTGTKTPQTITNPLSNSLFLGNLVQTRGTITIKTHALTTTSQGAQIQNARFPMNLAIDADGYNVFDVVSQDETEKETYNLIFGYLGEEVGIASIVLKQKDGTSSGNTMGVGVERTFSTANNAVSISGDQIIVSGVVKGRGELVLDAIDFSTLGQAASVQNNVPIGAVLAVKPNVFDDNTGNNYKFIVVKSASNNASINYKLKLNFLGTEADIVSLKIAQANAGQHIETNSKLSKSWLLTPLASSSRVEIEKAYLGMTGVPAQFTYSDLKLSDGASIVNSPNNTDSFPITPPSTPTTTSTFAMMTIKSEDGYNIKPYSLVVQSYLSTQAVLVANSASITQTINGFNNLNTNTPFAPQNTALTIGVPSGGVADLTIPSTFTKKFVNGYGGLFSLAFAVDASANASLISPITLNTSLGTFPNVIAVRSEDNRSKTTYNLNNILYYNNGTTLKTITFSYSHPTPHDITGIINGNLITFNEKLVKNLGTLTLKNNTLETGVGVASSLNATVTMAPHTVGNNGSCLNCVKVVSESAITQNTYSISYDYLSSDVALTSLSFKQGAGVFNTTSGLVSESTTQNGGVYVLKGVVPNGVNITFDNIVVGTNNIKTYNNANVLTGTVLTSPTSTEPTLYNLVIQSEDKQKSLTYTFRIEYAISVTTESFADAPNKTNRIGAGDFTNPDLYKFSFFPGSYTVDLTLGTQNGTKTITLPASGLAVVHGDILTPAKYTLLSDGSIALSVVVKSGTKILARSGVTNIKKEQYKIRTWQDLQGMDYNISATGNYTLEQDITFPGPGVDGFVNFKPIGRGAYNSGSNAFKGSLDGKYYKIINLYINGYPNTGNSYVALFSGLHDNANIKNIVFVNPKVYGNDYVGVLVANAGVRDVYTSSISVSISNVGVIGGYVEANNLVGGLVGISRTNTSIESSFYIGTIKVNGSDRRIVGGLIGELQGYASVKNCFTYGQLEVVTSSLNLELGGFIGVNYIAANTIQTFIESNFSLMSITGLAPSLSTTAQNYNRVGFMYGYSAQTQIGATALYFSVPDTTGFSFTHTGIPTMALNSVSPTVTAISTTNVATGSQTLASSGIKEAKHIDVQDIKTKTTLISAGFILSNVWRKDNTYMGGLPYLNWMTANARLTQDKVLQVQWQ
jgi:hypothetical protein